MNYNILFSLTSLFYILMLTIVFFFKKRLNSLENKIYKYMVIFALSGVILELSQVVTGLIMNTGFGWINSLVSRFYLVNVLIWISLLSIYTIVISFEKKYYKKLCYIIIDICAICSCCLLFLPINYYFEPGKTVYSYTYGTSVDLLKLISIIFLIFSIFCMIINIKHLRSKKYFPIIIYTILFLVSGIIQIVNPILVLNQSVQIFTTFLMYFTIENPDLKIIHQLDAAKDQADKANRAKTDFLSSMSHEIRTPLNAIVGFGQALAKEDISGTAKEEVQDILMASNILLDIVNGILDISKIEADKVEIVNGEYSTKKLVNEITSLINARIGSKPLDFKVLVDEKLPPVLYGDSSRIKQVTINLLTNAVKYTSEGRILFQVKADNNEQKDICKLTISVQDTGMGMTEEDIENLFTKFQRFDMDKNVNVEGTGLGMAITKGLVELMNGQIDVKSKYGEGSTFTITLDQKIIHKEAEVIEDTSTLNQVKAFNAAGQKVLVVDDNKINLKVAERLLREYNLTVEFAHSGSESIDKVLDGKVYDLIFMDIMMPKMNGIETLENLKNIVGFNMPVVALTADVISGMEEKYISVGFDDCLAKPIVEEELYFMLKKFLKETEVPKGPVTTEDLQSNEAHNIELLENNRINVAAGLELLKDMDMYNMTLEEFYNELQNKITDLEKYKAEGNMDDYAILAHALKTEARYVGCNELGDMAYEHELAGKEKNKDLVNQKFEELKTEANRVYEVIKRYLGE